VTDWNFADVWELVADTIPDALALIHGDRTVTWASFERRADAVARAFLDLGVEHQDKVAHYLYNCPEYATPRTSSSICGRTPTPRS
jgi:fatty-acyl-CoA synthase